MTKQQLQQLRIQVLKQSKINAKKRKKRGCGCRKKG